MTMFACFGSNADSFSLWLLVLAVLMLGKRLPEFGVAMWRSLQNRCRGVEEERNDCAAATPVGPQALSMPLDEPVPLATPFASTAAE
jgi:hypothetical protein